eukprot:15479802-Alexandrium_andersonii.AAC.1
MSSNSMTLLILLAYVSGLELQASTVRLGSATLRVTFDLPQPHQYRRVDPYIPAEDCRAPVAFEGSA